MVTRFVQGEKLEIDITSFSPAETNLIFEILFSILQTLFTFTERAEELAETAKSCAIGRDSVRSVQLAELDRIEAQ